MFTLDSEWFLIWVLTSFYKQLHCSESTVKVSVFNGLLLNNSWVVDVTALNKINYLFSEEQNV